MKRVTSLLARLPAPMVVAAVAVAVVATDQAAKQFVLSMLQPSQTVPVVSPWLTIRLRLNTGGPLGIWPGHNAEFLIVTIAALVLLAFLVLRAPFTTAGLAGMGGITGGAVSTLLDQIRLGGAVDFLGVSYVTFNLADVGIILGGLVCVLGPSLRTRRANKAPLP
jgi:lipoprotein signal peptidase